MPATMPENSTRGSSARIKITSCFGRKLRITATTRILNGSGFVPENTVSACPTIPGLTSASGRIAGGGPEGTMALSRVGFAPAAQTGDAPAAPKQTTSSATNAEPARNTTFQGMGRDPQCQLG